MKTPQIVIILKKKIFFKIESLNSSKFSKRTLNLKKIF